MSAPGMSPVEQQTMIFFFKDATDSNDLNALGSMFPTRTYCDRNSLSHGMEGLLEWMEVEELGDHAEVRLEISLIRSSKAKRRLAKERAENSKRTIRGLLFSLNPIIMLVLDAKASRSEWLWEREMPSLKRGA